jgi:Xaa-Pro aminopeptidase
VLDLAPRHEGYPGDNSRTRLAGDPGDLPALHKKAYDASLLMNQEVRKAIEPGVTPKSLHDLAMEVAESEGMDQYRRGVDLLGHGLEMDIPSDPPRDDGRASRSRRGVAPGA